MLEINRAQYNLLEGFYSHCFNAYHNGITNDFGFWAEQLDGANIPWGVQNHVSCLAETKESSSQYLTTHLKKYGVDIKWAEQTN